MPVEEEDIRARMEGRPLSLVTRSNLVAANRDRIPDVDYRLTWVAAILAICLSFALACAFVFIIFGGLDSLMDGTRTTYAGCDQCVLFVGGPCLAWLTLSIVIVDAVHRRFVKKYKLHEAGTNDGKRRG